MKNKFVYHQFWQINDVQDHDFLVKDICFSKLLHIDPYCNVKICHVLIVVLTFPCLLLRFAMSLDKEMYDATESIQN